MKNYYQVLGLQENATLDEIRMAHKEYVVKFHPDKHNGDEFFKERFQEIQEAYDYLSKKRDNTCSQEPIVANFHLSSDEIIVGDKITLSWEIKYASHIILSIKTSYGIKEYNNLSSKGEMTIVPQSKDMNVGLSLKAINSISEIVTNRFIHLRNPPNQFNDSIDLKVIMWGIAIVGIIGLISLLFNLK